MKLSKLLLATLCLALVSMAAEAIRNASSLPGPAAKCALQAGDARPHTVAAAAAAAPCSQCTDECASQVKSCERGSVKACYLAAACLCQCNLDAGGCGSDKEALQECVNKNKKAARDLER